MFGFRKIRLINTNFSESKHAIYKILAKHLIMAIYGPITISSDQA
jgi:hypothetical protein